MRLLRVVVDLHGGLRLARVNAADRAALSGGFQTQQREHIIFRQDRRARDDIFKLEFEIVVVKLSVEFVQFVKIQIFRFKIKFVVHKVFLKMMLTTNYTLTAQSSIHISRRRARRAIAARRNFFRRRRKIIECRLRFCLLTAAPASLLRRV